MFRAPLCPSSGEQQCALPHMVFCTGSDGCGCVELGRELCAPSTSYAAVHTLVPLMMGIMMPETCWDKSLMINIRLVASCWSLSLSSPYSNYMILFQCADYKIEKCPYARQMMSQSGKLQLHVWRARCRGSWASEERNSSNIAVSHTAPVQKLMNACSNSYLKFLYPLVTLKEHSIWALKLFQV